MGAGRRIVRRTLRIADRVVSSGGNTDGFVARVTGAARSHGSSGWAVPGRIPCRAWPRPVTGSRSRERSLRAPTCSASRSRRSTTVGRRRRLRRRARWHRRQAVGADVRRQGRRGGRRRRDRCRRPDRRRRQRSRHRERRRRGPRRQRPWRWHGRVVVTRRRRRRGRVARRHDFDGLRAIAAVGERIVAAGFYSGSIRLGDRSLTAAAATTHFSSSSTRAAAWLLPGLSPAKAARRSPRSPHSRAGSSPASRTRPLPASATTPSQRRTIRRAVLPSSCARWR